MATPSFNAFVATGDPKLLTQNRTEFADLALKWLAKHCTECVRLGHLKNTKECPESIRGKEQPPRASRAGVYLGGAITGGGSYNLGAPGYRGGSAYRGGPDYRMGPDYRAGPDYRGGMDYRAGPDYRGSGLGGGYGYGPGAGGGATARNAGRDAKRYKPAGNAGRPSYREGSGPKRR